MDAETKSDLRAWVIWFKEFKYKPNFGFIIETGMPFGQPMIKMRMIVPNSRSERHEPVEIYHRFALGPYVSDEWARDHIHNEIRRMEDHEIDEWFRVKGELVFDPHKEKS